MRNATKWRLAEALVLAVYCGPFTDDRVAHEVTWKGRSLASLAGQVIRFEFLLREADLHTFRGMGAGA